MENTKDIIVEAIIKHYDTLPETDLCKILASTAKDVLQNRFITPTIMDVDKEKVHNVYFLEDRFNISHKEFGEGAKFKICARKTDFVVTLEELVSLLEIGAYENEEMTRRFYMVR